MTIVPTYDVRVAFQGVLGAHSHEAAMSVFPSASFEPCETFEEAIDAVRSGKADRAVIPIENSAFGRVAEVHLLLPKSGMRIVGEHFHTVHHCLMAPAGTGLDALDQAWSHAQALGQCRQTLTRLGLQPVPHFDTAGAARTIATALIPGVAAVASRLAAEIYDLQILKENIEDEPDNLTRFIILAAESRVAPKAFTDDAIVSLMFAVANVPNALCSALASFGDNGVNLVRLESYQTGPRFNPFQFYVDIEGSQSQPNVAQALRELKPRTDWVRVLGEYEQARSRD